MPKWPDSQMFPSKLWPQQLFYILLLTPLAIVSFNVLEELMEMKDCTVWCVLFHLPLTRISMPYAKHSFIQDWTYGK